MRENAAAKAIDECLGTASDKLWEAMSEIDGLSQQAGQVAQDTEAERMEWTSLVAGELCASVLPYVEERVEQVSNLSMLVRRLCRRLPKDDAVRVSAMDYLRRKGLQGSILRKGEQS